MIEYLAETGSTNSDLLARLRSGQRVAEGDWLVADRQKSGRGRQRRDWFDGTGNFMGSTIVHCASGDPPAATLALLAGLALYEACSGFCDEAARLSLKWPNDLLSGHAKVAGILLEAQGASVVVGVGVNLTASPDLPDRETNHFSALGPVPSRDDFAERLAAQFDLELERWRTYGLEPVIRRWLEAAHPVGTPLSVHDAGASLQSGTFAGLDASGALLLRLEDGAVRAIHAGDVILN